ncbi:MAG: hypothetical protein RLZZ142_1417 [Verrucomicrobiota bacterium]
MTLGITGASGLIGRFLADLALRRGHEVIAFSRSAPGAQTGVPAQAPAHAPRASSFSLPGCTVRPFPALPSDPPPDFQGCDAVVHLAGESVIGIWTQAKQERIRQSRLQGTRRVAEAILQMASPPEVLVSGSAIGFYGESGDAELLETSPHGTGFLAETCMEWETEAFRATPRTRVVALRTGLVLSPQGGALGAMLPVFRLGLGGRLGSGRQWMSWIHLEDLARLILFAVEDASVSGPVNGTAPWPVRNAEFTQTLAERLSRPAWFSVPAFALKLLGEFSHELLDSKRVLPGVATAHGFPFLYPELAPALRNLV